MQVHYRFFEVSVFIIFNLDGKLFFFYSVNLILTLIEICTEVLILNITAPCFKLAIYIDSSIAFSSNRIVSHMKL